MSCKIKELEKMNEKRINDNAPRKISFHFINKSSAFI